MGTQHCPDSWLYAGAKQTVGGTWNFCCAKLPGVAERAVEETASGLPSETEHAPGGVATVRGFLFYALLISFGQAHLKVCQSPPTEWLLLSPFRAFHPACNT